MGTGEAVLRSLRLLREVVEHILYRAFDPVLTLIPVKAVFFGRFHVVRVEVDGRHAGGATGAVILKNVKILMVERVLPVEKPPGIGDVPAKRGVCRMAAYDLLCT